jgi:hypothetical protein
VNQDEGKQENNLWLLEEPNVQDELIEEYP